MYDKAPKIPEQNEEDKKLSKIAEDYKKTEEINKAFDEHEKNGRLSDNEKKGAEEVAKRNRKEAWFRENHLPFFESPENRNPNEVFYTKKYVRYFDREELEDIFEDTKEYGTPEEVHKAELLIKRYDMLEELVERTRKLFWEMRSHFKGTEERKEAYDAWKASRDEVIRFDEKSLDMIFDTDFSKNEESGEKQAAEEMKKEEIA